MIYKELIFVSTIIIHIKYQNIIRIGVFKFALEQKLIFNELNQVVSGYITKKITRRKVNYWL